MKKKDTPFFHGLEGLMSPDTLVDAEVTSALVFEAFADLEQDYSELAAELAGFEQFLLLEDQVSVVLESVKENGIDAGTDAIVGTMMSAITPAWSASDAEGTVAGVEAGLEGVGQKVMDYIKKIIENLKQFFEKLWYNEALIRKAFAKQLKRVQDLDKAKMSWKKADKTFKVNSSKIGDIIENGVDLAEGILKQAINGGNFKVSKSDKMEELVSGAMIKKARDAAKRSESFECSKQDVVKFAAGLKAAFEDSAAALTALQGIGSALKSFRAKMLEEDRDNEYKPGRCISASAQLVSYFSIVCLRNMKTTVSIAKNIA